MMFHVRQRQDWIRGRRERRNLARTARLRRQVFRYLVLLLLLIIGGCSLRYLPWSLPITTSEIVVSGNQVVTSDQVKATLLASNGQPLYRLNPQRLQQQVEELEAVRYAFVHRYLVPRPHLVVDVLEEFPWASLSTGPDQPVEAVISQSGRIIPVSKFPAIFQPSFKIYAASNLQLNQQQVEQWSGWVAFTAAQTGRSVDSIDLRNPASVAIQNGDIYLKVGVADSSLTKRLGRLASLMPVLADLPGELQYIDLSLDNNIPLKVAAKSHSSNLADKKPATL
jgi:cell division septal protein FtsQ